MKDIRIIRLVLDNFKCHRHMELKLDGRNATLYGDNATGKTSVYDALTWLLFGKDSAGNGEKNIEIKPLDSSGTVIDHSTITSVEAELDVDGESMVLKRTYQEIWSTKRGSSETTYDGNTSEYFVDGVPCKKFAFDGKIKELVPEDTFRLLTSVSYFASTMRWQDRRAVLFDMSGAMSDRDIMAKDERFGLLLDALGKLNLDDLRKKLANENKKYVGVKDQTPARLNECQRIIQDIEGLDFAGAKAALAGLEERKEAVSAQLVNIRNNTAVSQKHLELREAMLKLEQLEGENRAYRSQQAAGNGNVDALRNQLLGAQRNLDSYKSQANATKARIAKLERSIDSFRERWMAVNGEAFDGGTCAACGQPLPMERLQAAQNAFAANKNKRLDEIMASANSLKEEKAAAMERIQYLEDEAQCLNDEILMLSKQIEEAEASRVSPTDMPDYAEKKAAHLAAISRLDDEVLALKEDVSNKVGKLEQQLSIINADIRAQQEIINYEGVLAYTRGRMDEIRSDATKAAQTLERIEQLLRLAEDYTRYKTRYVEDSINSLFRIARFRLFREQANGGVEDRCDVVYDGVPYISLNNGMKINVGIDIIGALSRHYGVTVPLFVDNAESVTRLEAAPGQVIRLYVSENDKELRVKHED